jgi:hypothetical protein
LKTSIDDIRVLVFESVSFGGRDESVGSTNRENFLKIFDFMVLYNKKVIEVIARAPKKMPLTHHQ